MEKIKKLIRKEKNTISINDFIVKSNPFDKINLKDLDVKKEEDKYNVKIIPSLEYYNDENENEKEIIREFTQKNNEYINEENIYNTSISLDGKTITFGDKTHKVVLILNTSMEWTSKLNESKNEILFSDSNGLCLIKLQDYGINIKTSIVSNLTYNYELTNLILEIENKTLLFKDTSTNEIIFKLGPIFAYENIDNQTSNIFIDKDNTTITFTLDTTWKNNCSNPIFIESNFHIESKPLITLLGEKNGFNENSIDNKFILGIYNKNSFSIKAKINTYNIISELLKCNYTNYKILIKFHFENGKRRNDSCGFKIYNESQEIGFDYLNDSYFNVNITDLIKYQIDNSIFDKDIVLTIIYAEFIKEIFGSDENLKTNIIDDYCYIYNESNDINNRPEIIFSCANESTVKDGNKFLSYSIKDLGESNINLFTGKLQHIINLDTIKENNLSLNIDLVYDNRTKNKNVLLDGWSINLQQKLIKKKDYNKILGSKDIIYIDGYNNQHVLSEKWFYMKDDIKHYIRKEDVFIDNDKKLKYRLNNDIFDVEYESSNEEGLRFFSFNNLNYIKKSDMKVEKKYFILLHDNEKLYLTKRKYISIPVFYNSEDIDIKNDQYELSLLPSRFKNYAEIKANKIKHYLGITYRDGKYYDLSNNIIPYKIIDCPILYKNNKQYVRIPTKIYKFKKESNNGYTEYTNKRISGMDVFIYSEESLYVDRSTPIIDYYSNNDIDNINNQIKQVNDYIISLKEQCENISNTIIKANSELEIMDINNEQYPLLKTDISTYEKSLNICANKLQEYEIKLCNLNETKKYLIEDQKQNIHDYIFNKDGNILGFDYYGKLIYISDKYDNEINIIYDDNKLTEINSKHNKIIFHYDDKKRLDYFIDSANRKKEITCKNRFIKINYNNDVINQFVFVQSNLISIANSNESIKFQYNQDNQITKISHTTFFDEISSEGSTKLSKVVSDKTITYDKFSTTVLDNLYENKEEYYFDDFGRYIYYKYYDQNLKRELNIFNNYENDLLKSSITCDLKDDNFISYISSPIGIYDKFEKEVDLSNINIPNQTLAFIRIDLRNMLDDQFILNEFNLKVEIDNQIFTQKYTGLNKTFIGIPFILKPNNSLLKFSINTTNAINFTLFGTIKIFKATGAIYEYDNKNRLIKIINDDSTIQYDLFDNDLPTLITKIDKFNNKTTIKNSYDYNGNLVLSKDNFSNIIEYYYDKDNNLIEERKYNQNSPTLVKKKCYSYLDNGNIKDVTFDNYNSNKITYLPNTNKISLIKYPNGNVVCYGYNYQTDDLVEISSSPFGHNNKTHINYTNGFITSLSHHNFNIDYVLDGQGRILKTIIDKKPLLTNIYEDNINDDEYPHSSKIKTSNKDGYILTIKDKLNRIVYQKNSLNEEIKYTYNNNFEENISTISKTKDNNLLEQISFNYDSSGNLISKKESKDGNDNIVNYNYIDDKLINISSKDTTINLENNIKNLLITFKFNDLKTNIKYDDLSRVIQKNIYLNNILLSQDDYEYLQFEDNALDLIKEHTFKLNNKILSITDYTYDISKNISSISYNNELIKYQYDTLNRLIKEVTPSYTKEYKYDNGGNIISIKEASNNILFEYSSNGWKDQLISIKDNNQETIINYDESGRMINIGSNNLSWNLYNQLTKFNEISFEYNMNGLRTSKTSPSKLHKYHYLDKLLIKETINELEIKYEYSLDNIIGFVYNNTRYIYQKNILKDVLKIFKEDSTLVAEYSYDSFGNTTVINYTDDNIGDINPIRYRSYYYDNETNLYFLQNRYYSPSLRRFISPDSFDYLDPQSINGLNLYIYCGNNPVNLVDPNGHLPFFILTGLLGLSLGVGITALVDYLQDKKFNLHWGWYLGSSLLGTAAGIGIGMGISYSATNTLTASIKDIRWGYAIKAAVKGNYTKVLKLSTFNPNSDHVALGRFINETSPHNYINIAKANGYTYFDMGKYYDFAVKLKVNKEINEMFLKTQYDLGKKFICTSLDKAGSYADELKFLKSLEAFTKFIIF